MNTINLVKELSSPTKIIIMCWILKEGEVTVTQLEEKTKINRINISKQICELTDRNFLIRTKNGKNNLYSLNKNLNENLIKVIKDIVNAYHIIDEKRGEEYEPYK